MNKILFALYAIFITYVSIRPANTIALEHWDKVFHLVLYGVFALLAYRTTKEPKFFLHLCIGIIAYSGLLEIVQSFMPGRFMSGYDFLANTVGVFIGALVAKTLLRANNTEL